ncbi:MAG: SDR family oxidoreductase [Aggregatilineales bacterium]
MTRHIFITGTNRGIGLAVVTDYLEQDDVIIFAACRNPDDAEMLQNLKDAHPEKLHLIALEVTDAASIDAAVKSVKSHTNKLDVLLNNAGINPPEQAFPQIAADTFMKVLEVNTVAPLMVTKAFYGLLNEADQGIAVHTSSSMASLTMRTYGGDYGYCASKAALNMVMRGMAADFAKYGDVITIALDPGWVQTDMGGQGATLTPQTSAAGIVQVIDNLKKSDNGRYLVWDGTEHPW